MAVTRLTNIKGLDAVNADTNGDVHYDVLNGPVQLSANGDDFGGGTVLLATSPDGGTTWFWTGLTLTSNGSTFGSVVADTWRLVLEGSTSPSNVTAFLTIGETY